MAPLNVGEAFRIAPALPVRVTLPRYVVLAPKVITPFQLTALAMVPAGVKMPLFQVTGPVPRFRLELLPLRVPAFRVVPPVWMLVPLSVRVELPAATRAPPVTARL